MDNRLLQVLDVPANKGRVCSEDEWSNLEATLGTSLPVDFKDFNEHFGAGSFDELLIMPLIPTDDPVLSFASRNSNAALMIQMCVDEGLVSPMTRAYPEPGGLLAWATSSYGHTWLWRTDGPCDGWPVVAMPAGFDQVMFEYPTSATGYLGSLLNGELDDEFSAELMSEYPSLGVYSPIGTS